jgi:phospholipase/lecithinase/hemolysin
LTLAAVALPASIAAAQGPAYTDLVVFGDSLSDVGNTANSFFISLVAPQARPPYFDGRFSNGPVWAEQLGDTLGLDGSTRSGEGGHNYAWGGALSGDGTNFLGAIDNLGNQVDDYLGGDTPDGTELFLLWGGGNDFIEIGGSLGSLFSGGGSPQGVANNLAGHIERLALEGGEHFLVLNMPDLGAIPRYAGTNDQAALTATSQQFNALLSAEVDALNAQYNVDVDLLDIEALFQQMLADPSRYGFTNTTDPAYNEDTGAVAPNAATYAFWDEIHPTALAHQWIATAAWVELQVEGDFTGDGRVDIDDLDLLLAHWGQTVTPFDLAHGDWTGDGQVDQQDLDRVLTNWGAGEPPAVNIPEPGGLALVGALWLLVVRRRVNPARGCCAQG